MPRSRASCSLLTTQLLVALCWMLVMPAAAADESVATIIMVAGDTRVESSSAVARRATVDSLLYAGDIIITGQNGRATLLLADESIVQVFRNTRLAFKSVDQSAGWLQQSFRNTVDSVYELLQGELFFRNKNPKTDLEITTPHLSIAVRGTEFVVRVVSPELTEVDMLEGRIVASNPLGSIEATSGEQVYASPGNPPRKRLLLNPDNAVQWTVVIPRLMPEAAAEESTPVAQAWRQMNQGNLNEAKADFATVTRESPSDNRAWQGLALARLATNDAGGALQAITTALKLEPMNANNYLLEGYAHQALFDFDSALEAVEQALALQPDNSLAAVKLAELYFGLGDIEAAKRFANRAIETDPTDPDALNLTGFLALAEGDTDIAISHFSAAISYSPAFASPYLGLGLANLRQGNDKEALESITTAVALDPTRSLYMSYWGRMLYQLGRHERALQVLERSAELDPRDPTPWYLQAIVLRDLNLFSEAIERYNRAVELNENRAVYRSTFLLDKDQALRNVDLSIIFQEFEFNAWAERKAVDAINDDFGNYTAHIMYGEALSEQENRDTAFISETLQTRILQPANFNSFNSFNQYSTFVDQPGIGGNVQLGAGRFDTHVGLAELFGASPEHNIAYQAGYLDTKTDGWNDIYGDDIRDLEGIFKWDATLQDSFLLTFTDIDFKRRGGAFRRFEYDSDPNPTEKDKFELTQVELGYRHNFSPGTDLLAYLSYSDQKRTNQFEDTVVRVDSITIITFDDFQKENRDLDFWQAQLQANIAFDDHEVIVGTSNYFGDNDADRVENTVLTIEQISTGNVIVDPNFFDASADRNNDRSFHSAYIQDTWAAADWLDLEGGLYYERLKNSEPLVDDSWTIRDLNPRFGSVIRASEHDTFRLFALRYIAPFFGPQLSPTELAGLTIYRNYREASKIKNADFAYERMWDKGFFTAGGFWSKGKSEARLIPPVSIDDDDKFDTVVKFTSKNRRYGGELELNQLISSRWGLVGRYLYADVTDDSFPEFDRKEHRVNAELRYIAPSGFSAGLLQGFRSINYDDRADRETINYTDIELQYLSPNRTIKLEIAARNIFDSNFNWVTDQFTLDGVIPRRNVFGSIEVNF